MTEGYAVLVNRSRDQLISCAVAALAGVIILAQAPAVQAQSQAPTPATSPQSVEALIKDLGIVESDTRVRDRKDWRVPKKIVFLGGDPGSRAQGDAFARILPGAEIVIAPDFSAAVAAVANADVIVGLTTSPGICDPDIIKNGKQLRWLLSMSAGVERCVSNPDIVSRNLLVTNLRAVDSATIAEHAVALALALARGLDRFAVDTKQGQWRRESSARMETLNGKTMLVVGLGGIGTEVASRGHALGMKITATRNSGRTGPDYVSYVGLPSELLTLAKDADVVVNTAPLTTETTGLFNARFFATMKPSAYFINIARGGSVVTADLQKALVEGRIAGAGLDVVDPEPLPPDNPLWKAPNLIITPHVSSRSDVQGEGRWIIGRENLKRYIAGGKMLSEVDFKREY
ncbi:MAG: D-2-hydroxyacid dehydrogenase [Gammaproteobacteria bacterium]